MIVFITLKIFFRRAVKVTSRRIIAHVQKASVSSPDVLVYLMYLCQWYRPNWICPISALAATEQQRLRNCWAKPQNANKQLAG